MPCRTRDAANMPALVLSRLVLEFSSSSFFSPQDFACWASFIETLDLRLQLREQQVPHKGMLFRLRGVELDGGMRNGRCLDLSKASIERTRPELFGKLQLRTAVVDRHAAGLHTCLHNSSWTACLAALAAPSLTLVRPVCVVNSSLSCSG